MHFEVVTFSELLVRGVKKDFVDVVDSLYNNDIAQQQFAFPQPLPYTFAKSHPIAELHSKHVIKPHPIAERHLPHLTKSRPLTERHLKHVTKPAKPCNEPYYFPNKENREPNILMKPTLDKRELISTSGKTKKLRNKKFYVNKEWLH